MILAWIERVENAFKGLMRFQKPTQHVSSQETDKPETTKTQILPRRTSGSAAGEINSIDSVSASLLLSGRFPLIPTSTEAKHGHNSVGAFW